MKKVLIVLLSVLLLISFVSCEKDKSEEIIETYEEFWKTYRTIGATTGALSEGTNNKETLDKDDFAKSGVYYALSYLGYEGVESGTDLEVTAGEGSTSCTYPDEASKLQTYKDVTVSAKTVDDKGNTVNTYSLTFNGTIKESGDSATDTFDANFTITVKDDTHTYTMKYVMDKEHNFISASVNGKAVDVRLLNSLVLVGR